jgi:hypothetical protein
MHHPVHSSVVRVGEARAGGQARGHRHVTRCTQNRVHDPQAPTPDLRVPVIQQGKDLGGEGEGSTQWHCKLQFTRTP